MHDEAVAPPPISSLFHPKMSPPQAIECYITATLLDRVDSLKPNLESDGYRVIGFNPSDDPSPDIIIPQLSLGFIYIDISDAEIECKQVDSMIDNLISRILNLENDIKNMYVIAHIPDQKSAEYKIEASVNAFCRLQNILLENASLQYQPHIFPIHFAAELTSVTQQVVCRVLRESTISIRTLKNGTAWSPLCSKMPAATSNLNHTVSRLLICESSFLSVVSNLHDS
ncbi:hypothetical protein BKA69DRAFT_431919 [Paraphysoderma sedebokerense]|nr:hypothetical protein BKA69DRAFT_431919 [Paraphysoderma sedebokerense]